jgi:hypothetical protein
MIFQHRVPAALPLGKRPGTLCTVSWVGLWAGLHATENLASTWTRSGDRPATASSYNGCAIPTTSSEVLELNWRILEIAKFSAKNRIPLYTGSAQDRFHCTVVLPCWWAQRRKEQHEKKVRVGFSWLLCRDMNVIRRLLHKPGSKRNVT